MNYFGGNTVGNNGHATAGMATTDPKVIKERVDNWLRYASEAEKKEMLKQLQEPLK